MRAWTLLGLATTLAALSLCGLFAARYNRIRATGSCGNCGKTNGPGLIANVPLRLAFERLEVIERSPLPLEPGQNDELCLYLTEGCSTEFAVAPQDRASVRCFALRAAGRRLGGTIDTGGVRSRLAACVADALADPSVRVRYCALQAISAGGLIGRDPGIDSRMQECRTDTSPVVARLAAQVAGAHP